MERTKRAHTLMASSDEELCHLLEVCGIVKSEMDTLLPSLKEEERKRLDMQCRQQGIYKCEVS